MTNRTAKQRDMTRERKHEARIAPAKSPPKLDQLAALLLTNTGASIAEMTRVTGWQQHSVRGAMAGALKRRGLIITSEKIDGERRYTASRPA